MSRPTAHTFPDWLLGAPGKRLVLTRVFDQGNVNRVWTERDIHRAVGAERHASLGKHLDSLTRLGFMQRVNAQEEAPRRYALVPADDLDGVRREVSENLSDLLPVLAHLARPGGHEKS